MRQWNELRVLWNRPDETDEFGNDKPKSQTFYTTNDETVVGSNWPMAIAEYDTYFHLHYKNGVRCIPKSSLLAWTYIYES